MEWLEQFEGLNVRFLKAPNGQPVIVGADLINGLKGDKYNAAVIIKNNVRSKWWIDLPNPKGGKSIRCLFEPGAYQLAGNPMFQSEFAEKFQDWLFEEVLPKLRASGGYISPSATSDQLNALQEEIKQLQREKREAISLANLYDAEYGNPERSRFYIRREGFIESECRQYIQDNHPQRYNTIVAQVDKDIKKGRYGVFVPPTDR